MLMNDSQYPEEWTYIIEPKGKWFDLKLKEIWSYRDLIYLFFHRDFVSRFKQTILGPIWYLIQPLFSAGIFTVVFGNIAQISTDGLPKFLFYMSGTVVWRYFADCLAETSSTFSGNAALFGKVYFPRMSLPISKLLTNLVAFSIQFLFFLCFLGYFLFKGAEVHPNSAILLFPVLLILMAAMGLGVGIIVSSATTKYRDLQHLVGFGTQLLMYATPIIYPLSAIPGKYRWLLFANPMTPVVEAFRYGFMGAGSLDAFHLLYSGLFSLLVLVVGLVFFNRIERTFMDTV